MTTSELAADGYGRADIAGFCRTGRLRPKRRGVFAYGDPPVSVEERWRQDVVAELAAAGRGAALGAESAAAFWQLDGFREPQPLTIVVADREGPKRRGVNRWNLCEPFDTVDGVPVTSVLDTLADLGRAHCPTASRSVPHMGSLRIDELVELALESALRSQRPSPSGVDPVVVTTNGAVLSRPFTSVRQLETGFVDRPRRPGGQTLNLVLSRRPLGAAATESPLETRGIQVLRRGGLPEPERQVVIYGPNGRPIGRVDQRIASLLIEYDGNETHAPKFDEDRARWTNLQSAGHPLVVFTWKHLHQNPDWVIRSVTDALRHGAGPPFSWGSARR